MHGHAIAPTLRSPSDPVVFNGESGSRHVVENPKERHMATSTHSDVIPGSNSVSGAASRAHHIVDDMAEKAVPAVQTATKDH